MILAAYLMSAGPAVTQLVAAQPVEIVVTAPRKKCRVSLADRVLSRREFDARADEWAKGTAVRIVASERLGYKCLARIAFRLGDRGVRLIEFVDPPAAAAKSVR